jgi:hypothetical protein
VIYANEVLGEIKEPNWKELSEQFDESGFEIYTSRALVEVDDEALPLSRDVQANLDLIRTRFFEVAEFSNSLNDDEKERLLKRWEEELADFSSAFIGQSLSEWLF